mgnify:CR=1 FL=1
MDLSRIIAVRNNKTIYRDKDACIKVFNEDYSKADVLNEALNQARVEETGLNIPKIREVITIDGKWAIVSDYIQGKTLARLMEENKEQYDEYLALFVSLQMKMHSMQVPLLVKLKDKMARCILQADLDATTRYDLHTRLESMPKHNKLCHGDFNPGNIVITEDQTPFILDWSHATQGNASADVARTYLLFCLKGDQQTADRYLDLFCQMSGAEKRYVQKWLPLVAAAQSIKGNEKERAFLLDWVRVVEYE